MKLEAGPNPPPDPAGASSLARRTRFAAVYDLLEQAIADHAFPGCTFGVIQGGDLQLLDSLGRQTYQLESPAIVPSTVYDLASLTKVLATTAMAMILHDRQQLDLDQPLFEILPAFQLEAFHSGPAIGHRSQVTLRHLLSHSSGLAGYARLFEVASTPEALLDACLHMPLQHPPGTFAEYSDIGFILLGKALEALAGEPINPFCQREIFSPLGMTQTRYQPPPSSWPSIPPSENDLVFRGRVIQGEVQDENCWVMGGVSGHAGLFGNVADILQFSRALLLPQQHPLFHPDTVRLFSTKSGTPPATSRALGWDTPSAPSSSGSLFSPHSIGHLGYAGTSLWIDLADQVAVVLLTNRTWPSRDNQKIRSIRPLFHDRIRTALTALTTNVG